jgi:hypothetical protein
LENCSYELQCACWFSQAGWQVFTPLFDHGHKTDLLISDGEYSYRIQVKTAENASDGLEIPNQWNGSKINYVALFAKNSTWGMIFPAFSEAKRSLKDVGGCKFELRKASFMKAFHSLP